jgi:hypothetical protein
MPTMGSLIRNLRPEDAPAIAYIAAQNDGFTVPSSYMVWMLAQTQNPLCRVAVDADGNVVGYILAIATCKSSTIFAWQLAIRTNALFASTSEALCCSLLEELKRQHISKVLFTTNPGKRARLLTKLLTRLGSRIVKQSGFVELFPPVNINEEIYEAAIPE